MTKREVAEKLLSSGLTLFGFLAPVLMSVLAIGTDPSIGSNYKDSIDFAVKVFFIPTVVLIAAHLLICLCVVSGGTKLQNVPPYSAGLVIAVLTAGLLVFAFHTVGG